MEREAWTAGDVHCWIIDLCRPAQAVRALCRVLDTAELSGAGQIQSNTHRRRYVVAHAAVRHILAWYLACDPAGVRFRRSARGKPEIEGRFPRFSLSRCGDIALLAVASQTDIGVDIERVDAIAAKEIAEMFPHHVPPGLLGRQRTNAFFQAWTRLEAHAKALGDGIEPHLHRLYQFFSPSALERRGWWFQEIQVEPGYVATLAAPGPRRAVAVYNQLSEEKSGYVNYTPSSTFPEAGRGAAVC